MKTTRTRSVAAALSRFAARLDDRVNPIALKQLRQAVKAKYVAGLLVAFLVIQLVVIGSVALGRSDQGSATGLGRQAFMILYGILVAVCAVFVPFYVAGQLFVQRALADVDLFALTTMRPRSVVWGQLFSGVLLSLLIHSAFAPFLAMSYLLRGIDLDVIAVLLVLGFSASVVMIQFGILLACIPAPRPIRPVLGLFVLGGGVVAVWGALAAAEFLTGSTWLHIPLEEFWGIFAVLMVSGLMLVGLFYVLSLGLVSPRAANRALPIRIYLTALWLVSLVLVVIFGMVIQEERPLDPWMYANVGLFSFCILFAAGERETFGPRVTRTIPRTPGRRALAFLFYSGAAGGITWATLMVALTLAVRTLWHLAVPLNWSWIYDLDEYRELVLPMAGLGAFAFAYAATGVVLRKGFMPARNTTWAWALIILVVAVSLVPVFIGALVMSQTYRRGELGPFYMLTPIALTAGYEDYRSPALIIALIWAVVAGAQCHPWFVAQVRAFRRREPAERREPVEAPGTSEPPSPTPAAEDTS